MDATLGYVEKRGEKRSLELCQLLVRDGRLDELNEAASNRSGHKILGLLKTEKLYSNSKCKTKRPSAKGGGF